MATSPKLTIEALQRELGVSDPQLDFHIKETDLFELAGCFDNTIDYVEKLELSPKEQIDVKKATSVHGTQSGMKEALKYWRSRNSEKATFRALLLILLAMSKGSVAEQVCKYLSQNIASSVDPQCPTDTKTAISGQVMNFASSVMSTTVYILKRVFLNFPTDVQLEKESIMSLYLESNELAAKFESLCSSLILSLKRRDRIKDELAHCMLHVHSPVPIYEDDVKDQPIFRRQRDKLLKATSVDEIWAIVCYYFSFFNYYLVEHIIEQLGTKEDKERMAGYKEEFDKYAKRRAYECPTEFGYNNEDDSTIIVKLDKSYDGCTLFQIEKLRKKFCAILGIPESSLRLITIEKGCYKLTFQAPSFFQDTVFPLSAQQQSELSMLGIVWIQCGDYEYHLVPRTRDAKNNPNNDPGDDDDTTSQGISIGPQAAVYSAHPVKRSYGAFSDSGVGKTATETASLISDCTEDLFAGGDLLGETEKLPGSQHTSTHLNVAAFNGDLTVVKYCIEVLRNKPFNEHGDHGETTLHIAAAGGNLTVVKHLCNYCSRKNISPAVRTTTGKTPLHFAAQNGHLSLLKYFIETLKLDPTEQDNQLITPLLDACRSGNLEVVKYLMKQAEQCLYQTVDSIIHDTTKLGSTMLHLAAASGSCSLIEHLITQCKISPDVSGQFGATPFLIAAQEGHIEALHFLASLKNCDVFSSTHKGNHNALHFAASRGHMEVTEYLTNCIKLNPIQKDSAGRTPLHLAALYGRIDIARFFIVNNHLQTDLLDNNRNTPLHCASLRGSVTVAAYLVEDCKCNPLCVNVRRETPLHIAASNGHTELVKYFAIHCKVDPFCKHINYKTPLDLAMQHNQVEIVLFYIQQLNLNSARLGDKLIYSAVQKGHLSIVKEIAARQKWTHQRNGFRQSQLLLIATVNGHVNVLQFLTCIKKWKYLPPKGEDSLLHQAALHGHLNVVRFLIEELKYDPCVQDQYSSTPLHSACFTNHIDVIVYFFENTKLDNSYLDDKSMTPLHYAASYGRLQAVECLTIRLNCNITCKDKNGNTPLHCATGKGHLEVVKFFVSTLGQSPETVDANNCTLLHIACMYGHSDIIEYLLESGCNVSPVDFAGCTPAFYLARFDRLNDLKTLLKRTGIEELTHRDNNNYTLLHQAASYGQLKVIKYLVLDLSMDPNILTESGHTPLHLACSHGHKDVAQFLVNECGCEMMPTKDGVYPIHLAAEAGHLSVFKWLILSLHIDPLCSDKNGDTSFHYVAKGFHVDIADFCLSDLSINPMTANNDGFTALHSATNVNPYSLNKTEHALPVEQDSSNDSSIDNIQQKLALNFIEQCLNIPMQSSKQPEKSPETTPRHKSSKSELTKQVEMVKLLIKYDCQVSVKTYKGEYSALHFAAYHGSLGVVEILLSVLKEQEQNSPEIPDEFGMTPLHHACIKGHVKVIDLLASKPTLIGASGPLDKDNQTPLHLAAINGHLEAVKLLTIKKSYSPYCEDKLGATPLQYAVAHGHLEIVDFLLSNLKISPTYTGSLRVTPFQLACLGGHKHIASYLLQTWKVNDDLTEAFFAIITRGNLDMVQYILSLKKFNKKALTSKKFVLHYAAARGTLEILVHLITKLHFSPNVKVIYDLTPLHMACIRGNEDIANYLLSLPKCNAHAVTTTKFTALHFASQQGMLETVKILTQTKGCKVHQKENKGNNSLHFAAMHGHLPIVKFFTTVLKSDPSIPGEEGWTPLHFAANYDNLQVVEFLVSKLKVKLNVYEEHDDGATPLHLACRFGNLEIVKYLAGVYKSRKMEEPGDVDGETPLHYAARSGHLSIVKHLTLKMGYDPLCRERDNGDTPLHLAAQKGHADVVIFFIKELNCDPLIRNHFNVILTPMFLWKYKSLTSYEFGYKNRELHKAAEEGLAAKVGKLIKENKNVNHRDTLNRTPLHYAAMGGDFSVVNKLVLAGANPLAEDVFHNLPIHYAAALGHSQATDRLYAYCDLHTARGVFNMTPIDMAIAAGHREIARQLKKGYNNRRMDSFLMNIT